MNFLDKVNQFITGLTDSLVVNYNEVRQIIRDVIGVVLIVFSIILFLGMLGFTSGTFISPLTILISNLFGIGVYFILLVFIYVGFMVSRLNKNPLPEGFWKKILWSEITIFILITILGLWNHENIGEQAINNMGGTIGWGLAEIILSILPSVINRTIAQIAWILFFTVILVFSLTRLWKPDEKLLSWLDSRLSAALDEDQPDIIETSVVMNTGEKAKKKSNGKKTRAALPPEFRKRFKVKHYEDVTVGEILREDSLPPISLLSEGKSLKPSERHINQTAGLIEKTLADFGVPASVVDFQMGPSVTQFAVQPGYIVEPGVEDEQGQKVRVSQIIGLQRDLALALSAERLRIQAPVPGRRYVGIEIPNDKSTIVRLKPLLETEAFQKLKSPLAIALGRDVSGKPVVADLARMPHLLIAGTTGSGKSVCIAAILVCLIMNNTPDELKLVIVDPKKVEMVGFKGLPHLVGDVVTDLETINATLRWVVMEMERRYQILEESRSRDIDSYNKKIKKKPDIQKMPKLVVLIDELADLMMAAGLQTETALVRLAQKSRAVGIHLVVATQRPSTNVVTGLIKANFPARISFMVASGVDSRVILDHVGAEHLLGKGDMLFLPPESGKPIRNQGVWISDSERRNLMEFWNANWDGAAEEISAPWEGIKYEQATFLDKDDLVEKAIEVIKVTKKASASHLQRRLRVGYPRAARLIDELEDMGVLGPSQSGGREREILIDIDDEYDDDLLTT